MSLHLIAPNTNARVPNCSAGCPNAFFGNPVAGCKACPANSNRAPGGFAKFPAATTPAGALAPCVCNSGYLAINFANATLQSCVLSCPANYYVDSTGKICLACPAGGTTAAGLRSPRCTCQTGTYWYAAGTPVPSCVNCGAQATTSVVDATDVSTCGERQAQHRMQRNLGGSQVLAPLL
jgi:hypothetical protein